jgi:hypothetical protein
MAAELPVPAYPESDPSDLSDLSDRADAGQKTREPPDTRSSGSR